jgi:hypothetical protein
MKLTNRSHAVITIIFIILLSACTAQTPAAINGVTPSVSETPKSAGAALPTPIPTATQPVSLLPAQVFAAGSPFCKESLQGSQLQSACDQDMLTVKESADRRKVDTILMWTYPLQVSEFNLEVDVTSVASADAKTDQNSFGFYFTDSGGFYRIVRIQGQYFYFESGQAADLSKAEEKLNSSYSPFIKPAGQKNHFQFTCTSSACDLYANGDFIGRSTKGITNGTQTIGILAASSWDELFGQVDFANLIVTEPERENLAANLYVFQDNLKEDNGTFAKTGLSGAFNSYDEDGFHFSPVIPYGYYAAKTGPSLENTAVNVTVKMNIDPERPATQYAGLVCRSSQDGMYMAVIRADGTYSIYRDTPKQKFSLLAERTSKAIQAGLNENRLRLECKEKNIAFFINDQLVESLTDARHNLSFGRAGIYTKAGGEPDADAIVFSDFSIEEMQ